MLITVQVKNFTIIADHTSVITDMVFGNMLTFNAERIQCSASIDSQQIFFKFHHISFLVDTEQVNVNYSNEGINIISTHSPTIECILDDDTVIVR